MATKINYLDCNESRLGTGVLDCEIQTGVPTGFFLVKKDWRFDPETEDFDGAYIDGEIKAGNMIPFLNAMEFELQNEDAEIFVSNLKDRVKVMEARPGFLFRYNKGRGFHKAAYSYNSSGTYDFVIAYNNGVIDAALTPDGLIKGYNGGMIDTDIFTPSDGSNPQWTPISFQLTNSYEYNTQYALLEASANNFSLGAVMGVIDVRITKMSNATTDVVARIDASNNSAIIILGLTDADFIVEGTTETISSVTYDATTKEYTLEFSGSVVADYADMKISLYDAVDSTYVIKKGVTLYQGSSK